MSNSLVLKINYNHFINYLLIALVISSVCLFATQSIMFLILFLVIAFIYQLYGKSAVFFFSIFSLLVATSETAPTLRVLVQVSNYLVLLFFSIKENGIEFWKVKIPKEVLVMVTLILSSIFISLIFSDYFEIGYPQFIRQVLFFILVYLFYSLIKTEEDVKAILISLISVGIYYGLVIFYFLIQNNFNLILIVSEYAEKYYFKFMQKSAMGLLLGIFISMLLPKLIIKDKRKRKITLWLILYLLFSLFILNSRGPLLITVIVIFIFLYLYKKKIFFISLITLTIIIFLILLTPLNESIFILLRLENIATGRDVLFNSSIEVIKNNFFFGSGPAGIKYEMYKHLLYNFGSFEELFIRLFYELVEVSTAHNFYLFYFSELGIIGFLSSILIPVLFFKFYYRLYGFYKNKNQNVRNIIFGCCLSGIFVFLFGIVEPVGIATYGRISSDFPFWLIIIIMCFYYSKIEVYN